MNLRIPTLEDCQQVRIWRNEVLETLRTPYPLTPEMQEDFYHKVISNRNSDHRYWSIYGKLSNHQNEIPQLMGFGGLTYIEWENSQAEISLIIKPDLRGKGYGEKAVHLLLEQAFNYLGLRLVYGEAYFSNQNSLNFWIKITEAYKGQKCQIRKGKHWKGQHYNTCYFDITKDEFNAKK